MIPVDFFFFVIFFFFLQICLKRWLLLRLTALRLYGSGHGSVR